MEGISREVPVLASTATSVRTVFVLQTRTEYLICTNLSACVSSSAWKCELIASSGCGVRIPKGEINGVCVVDQEDFTRLLSEVTQRNEPLEESSKFKRTVQQQ